MSYHGDSLGSLVDRLSILNLKIWFMQDRVFKAAKEGVGLDAETTAAIASLNLDRNKTMTAIDTLFAEAVKSGKATVDPRVKIT